MHRVIDALQNDQHTVEGFLQLLCARSGVAEAQQVLQQQLILCDSLNWLK